MKERPVESPTYDIFSRLRSISPALFALDHKPLIPEEYTFPLDQFCKLLSQAFDRDFSLTLDEKTWVEKASLQKEKELNSFTELNGSVFGISTPLSLFFSKETLIALLADLVETNTLQIQMQPPLFLEAFEAFFFAQVIASVKECAGFEKMELRLTAPKTALSFDSYFLQRYTMRVGKVIGSFLIALPSDFLQALRSLPQSKEKSYSEWIKNLPLLPIIIEAARIQIPLPTLKTVRPGDILLVDFPFFIPGSERARVILTYRGIPLFRAKVKNGVIKLLEMSHNQQAFQPIIKEPSMNPPSMQKPQNENASPEESFEDLPEEEMPSETETTVEEAAPSQKVSLDDLPLLVVVQLKELSMTIEQLQALQPGNLLDLDIHPEQATVQLSVQGNIIGEGDLITIGDKIGVRIRTIGSL